MTDKKPVPPSLAQFALEQLAEAGEQAAIDLTVQNVEILRAGIERRDARIAELEAERNRLLNNPKDVFKKMCDMALKQRDEFAAELAALKAQQPRGVVDGGEARHDAVKALHDVMEAVPCSSLYSMAEAVLDAGYSLNPCRTQAVPDGWRMVKVGVEGVQFGNAWFSHEGITGYTAEQLNSGNCRVTGRAYMDWLAAAPSAKKESGQ